MAFYKGLFRRTSPEAKYLHKISSWHAELLQRDCSSFKTTPLFESKCNVGLKTGLLQGLSEPEFYGDFVYKFRKMIDENNFPYHFKGLLFLIKRLVIA